MLDDVDEVKAMTVSSLSKLGVLVAISLSACAAQSEDAPSDRNEKADGTMNVNVQSDAVTAIHAATTSILATGPATGDLSFEIDDDDAGDLLVGLIHASGAGGCNSWPPATAPGVLVVLPRPIVQSLDAALGSVDGMAAPDEMLQFSMDADQAVAVMHAIVAGFGGCQDS